MKARGGRRRRLSVSAGWNSWSTVTVCLLNRSDCVVSEQQCLLRGRLHVCLSPALSRRGRGLWSGATPHCHPQLHYFKEWILILGFSLQRSRGNRAPVTDGAPNWLHQFVYL